MPETLAQRVDLMGCPVDGLTLRQTVARVRQLVRRGEPTQHMCVNANKVVQMHGDPELRRIVRESDLISADGAGVVLASHVLGRPLPTRVTGVDLFMELMRVAPLEGWRPYLLGARPQVIDRTVGVLQARFPGLRLAGYRDGYFSPDQDTQVAQAIRDSGADLLFVGMPSPRKEVFLGRSLQIMQVPFAMGVGGTFDVVAGQVQRAPRWARDSGLEWAFRLAQEPRKMWRRNVYGSTTFLYRTVKARQGTYRLPED